MQFLTGNVQLLNTRATNNLPKSWNQIANFGFGFHIFCFPQIFFQAVSQFESSWQFLFRYKVGVLNYVLAFKEKPKTRELGNVPPTNNHIVVARGLNVYCKRELVICVPAISMTFVVTLAFSIHLVIL